VTPVFGVSFFDTAPNTAKIQHRCFNKPDQEQQEISTRQLSQASFHLFKAIQLSQSGLLFASSGSFRSQQWQSFHSTLGFVRKWRKIEIEKLL
jgi:hypothetical protein